LRLAELRRLIDPKALRKDGMAGLVLGVESVPDGLASGLLAGVNPVAGLYAYMVGSVSAAFFTSTAFMAVQGTGAMAIIVGDVDLASREDPARALFTLSILTGVVMVLAGYLKLGGMLRFVPNSVMVGFISAVGINIVLGQLTDFTGYDADGANRVARALDLLLHFWKIDLATFIVGVATVAMIIVLRRTRLGALGLVVAVVLGSALAAIFQLFDVEIQLVGNIAEVPRSLPLPALPSIADIPILLIPAFSLAFVGLVQGAAVTSGFPNPDGSSSDISQDFMGQGAGNIASGILQGMPVGGSMSASSLLVAGGARSRLALIYTGLVMALVILLLGGVVEYVAMPSLAGLLIIVGIETIKPADIESAYKTGQVQAAVMIVTLVLTLLIPLQYAVLVGVGISMILYIVRQANEVVTRRLVIHEGGRVREEDPPPEVPANDVVVLQPYGSLFFAAAPVFEAELPVVAENTRNSVVIIRLRGKSEVGYTLIEVLENYAESLAEAKSKLMIVTDSDRIRGQFDASGATDIIGEDNIYHATEWLMEAIVNATADAEAWVADHQKGAADD
jgi:SulP family sulfate permease